MLWTRSIQLMTTKSSVAVHTDNNSKGHDFTYQYSFE